VTYNIHKGIGGVDRRYRLDRIAEVLATCHGDVVLLQEVTDGVPRSRWDRQVDILGDSLGFEHRAYFPNVRLRHGAYGNAILSRLPLDHAENIDLTVRFKKRRGALHARISLVVRGRRLRLWLFNIHLGLAEYERRVQLRRLLDWQRIRHAHHDTAVVIAGDFNDVWGRLGRVVLERQGFHGTGRWIRTFPAVRPLRPLDRVYVHGPLTIERAYRSRARLARQASDHMPLVVELGL
jgi:endonuclease/exonuclease/phosphatase family metal-dependent hydrolase